MGIAIKHLLEFGPFRMDPELRLLWRGQEPIPLSPKAFELLLVLAQRSGQVVLKDELMSLLWPDTFVEESNLGQHIFQLRKALGERAQEPSYIVTVPGRGYRFVHGVRTIATKADEEIVLEKHSRSRLVIEEEESQADRSSASASRLRRTLLIASAVAAVILLGAAVVLFLSAPQPKVLSVRQITHSGRVEPYGKILTDGLRLYFTERRGGTEALAQAPVTGGETSLISTSVPSLELHDIDPSKSRLLIGTQGSSFDEPLWIVSTEGGSARRVSDVLASESTVWSPDGHGIIYGHDAQIFTVGEDGAQPTKLLTAPGYVVGLRVAPDGKLLRYTVRDSGSAGTHLWESSADGRNPHLLSFGWKTAAPQWGEGESVGDWSPDGRYFVFRAAHDGVESLWAIRENSGWLHRSRVPIQLYSSPDQIGTPQFSLDGKKMFFVIYQARRELVRYDDEKKLFVPYLSGIAARLLSFSRDGKWVAYRSDPDGALWRSRADGTEKLQLTFPPMVAFHSSWSPDGKRIVFGATLPGQGARLYSVSADGGKPEALTASDGTDNQPSYSPQAQFIIFQRWTADAEGTRHSAICLLDLNTRQVRELPGTRDFDGVHWSPDGKYAAASDEANNRLMLYNFERQQWSKLSEGAAFGWGIRWSADSRYVYYQHSAQSEEQPIFRVRVSDRKVEQITSARQILRADVLGYSMTGLTPDNSPLASLIRRSSDVYAMEIDLP